MVRTSGGGAAHDKAARRQREGDGVGEAKVSVYPL